jgi:hypothetical protein
VLFHENGRGEIVEIPGRLPTNRSGIPLTTIDTLTADD